MRAHRDLPQAALASTSQISFQSHNYLLERVALESPPRPLHLHPGFADPASHELTESEERHLDSVVEADATRDVLRNRDLKHVARVAVRAHREVLMCGFCHRTNRQGLSLKTP